jgi:hypothetical protein
MPGVDVMSHDTLEKSGRLAASSPIHIVKGEPPHLEKWPRGWRYILVFGGTLFLWVMAILIGRWIG